MKKFYTLLICTLLLHFSASAQWMPMGGPEGGSIQSLEHDDARLYAGTSEGHLLAGDGSEWEIIYTFPDAVYTIFSDGNRLWVGTSEATWSFAIDGEGQLSDGIKIFEHSTWSIIRVDDTLFLATDSGPYFIKDGASLNNPVAIRTGLPIYSLSVTGIAHYDGKLYATVTGFTEDFADGRGVYVSADGGQTWLADLLVDNGNRYLYVDGTTLYAGTYSGLYYKTSSQAEWVLAEGMGEYNGSTDMVRFGDLLVVATFNGLFASEDGHTWEAYQGEGLTEYILFADVFNDSFFFGGYGVFRSEDAISWEKVSAGMVSSGILGFFVEDQDLWVGTNNSGIYQFAEGEWQEKNTGIENVLMAHSIIKKGETLFASTGSGVRKSTDNGETWVNAHGDLSEYLVPQYLVAHNNTLLAMSSGLGIYVSTNDGQNWVEANEGLTCGRGGCELYTIYKGSSGVYVLTGYGVFKWEEASMTWTDITVGALPPGPKWSILEDGNRLIVTTQDYGMFYTDDAGANWEEFSVEGVEGLFLSATSLIKGYDDYYFMIGLSYIEETNSFLTQVYYTPIDEIHWQPLMDNFPALTLPMVLTIKGESLFVGTSTQGVWRQPALVFLSADNEVKGLHSAIGQNFPNPFSGATTIRYEAPAVHELVILDARGGIVKTLKGNEIDAGQFEVQMDLSALPASIYYYYVRSAQSRSETKKMILNK